MVSDFAAVELLEEIVEIKRDEIDHLLLQRFAL